MAPWTKCALLLLLCLADPVLAARINHGAQQGLQSHQLASKSSGEAEVTEQCCCKEEACTDDAESKSGKAAVYSPAHGLCCKFRASCSYWRGYTIAAESTDFCITPQDTQFEEPDLPAEIPSALRPDVDSAAAWAPKPNTPAHTVDTFCDMQGHSALEARDEERTVDSEEAAAAASKQRRNAVISELVKELSKNSLDAMAKDIFSLYVCVRWAPNQEFTRLATDEIETEQMPKDANPYDLYSDGSFIPLRCSRNVNVYDADRSSNDTHFKYFEKALLSIADWLEAEQKGEVKQRLIDAETSHGKALEGSAKAFDLAPLTKFVAKCPKTVDSRKSVHVRTASVDELVSNCAAAKWWLSKLQDWHTAFPFSSFMAPTKAAAMHAPKKHEQVLVCFGKRVASQLHRRAGGAHLLTDQSAVGCHGFWSFGQSARMLRRTVWLWRPPTCQLAAMELDMKLKLMDAIADMNTQLFDALPAMILDEQAKQPQFADGSTLMPAGTVGTLGKLGKSVASSVVGAVGWLMGLNQAYQRMGLLLGNTVVKWAVCPLRPLADHHEAKKLDQGLGTEDDVARFYAQQAYSKFTGEGNALPGEECSTVQDSPAQQAAPRCSECSLGLMQESMPEPYGDDRFACPVRPLLPAKQQLKVLSDKHDTCFMHMTAQQWKAEEWIFRGHTPHRKQYNLTENPPTGAYESVKIMSWRRAPDSHYGLWRDFVTYARRCTEEEYAATPRWCQTPAVSGASAGGMVMDALQGVGAGAVAAATGAGAAVHASLAMAGKVQAAPPMNKAIGKRLTNWAYGLAKKTEGGAKSLYSSVLGRAKGRQDRLYGRLFAEVEAGELLHSASFQKELRKTGADSKGRQRYDRYAVACPCPSFDPDREFRMKYTWSEHALLLASTAERALPSDGLTVNAAFSVELQGASVLHMHDKENAWQDSYTFLRAGGLGRKLSKWHSTVDPHLSSVVGVDPTSMYDISIYGLKATYVCGTRKAMHDLALDFSADKVAGTPFAKCVQDGAARNQKLRLASPNALFLPEETVVRVTFAPLETCYHEYFTADAAERSPPEPASSPEGSSPEGSSPEEAAEAPKKIFRESDNSAYKAFGGLGRGCEKPEVDVKKQLPEELKKSIVGSTYRGIFIAKGLPEETLLEVLLDPTDVLDELKSV